MKVITISRQMGSWGAKVGEAVAKRLNYKYYWKEVILEAAKLGDTPVAALAAIDELGLLDPCPSDAECKQYLASVQKVVEGIYQNENAVIVGRAGQVILKGKPGALHLRIIAPLEVRVARIAEEHKITLSQARARVIASDEFRRNYLQNFYKINWSAPENYHAILNSALLIFPQLVETIIELNALKL